MTVEQTIQQSIEQLTKALDEAKKMTAQKQAAIDTSKNQRESDLALAASLKDYFDRVDKAFCDPDDIVGLVGVAETEAATLVKDANDLVLKTQPFARQAMRAYNEMEQAAKLMDGVKTQMAGLKKEDFQKVGLKIEDFPKSDIKKTLDAIFASLDAIREKSKEALNVTVLAVKSVSDLETAVGGDKGLVKKQFADIVTLAKCCKEAARANWDKTGDDYTVANNKKKEWDALFAERDHYAALAKACENALAAMPKS